MRSARERWLDDLLARATARGVLDAPRADALRALAAEADAGPEEPRRGPSAVTVAYALGAGLVVVALAWFLADRWRSLGAPGVLAVAAGYAALFALAGAQLARRGLPLAAGVATALTAATAPLFAWALLRLTGQWPDAASAEAAFAPYFATRLLLLDLAALLATLGALRWVPAARVRRDAAAPLLAAAATLALVHTGQALAPAESHFGWEGWTALAAAGVMLSAALAVDVAPRSGAAAREDHARWLYVGALVALHVGVLQTWPQLGPSRHVVAPLAVAELALGLRVRRRSLLAAGALDALAYVTWLAFEVFRAVLGFPFALATVGLATIGAAVLVQRRWPHLLRGDAAAAPRTLPGGRAAALVPAALGLALLVGAGPSHAPAARRNPPHVGPPPPPPPKRAPATPIR